MKVLKFAVIILVPALIMSCKEVVHNFFIKNQWKYEYIDIDLVGIDTISKTGMCQYAYSHLYHRLTNLLESARKGFPNETLYNELEREQEKFSKCDFQENEFIVVKYKLKPMEQMSNAVWFLLIDKKDNFILHGEQF